MRHHALSRIRILAQDPQPFQNSTLNEGITTEFRFVDDPLPRSRLNHNVLNDSEVGFSSPPFTKQDKRPGSWNSSPTASEQYRWVVVSKAIAGQRFQAPLGQLRKPGRLRDPDGRRVAPNVQWIHDCVRVGYRVGGGGCA
jgi:hypothetical protein